jgi:hypothetical protein
MSESTFEPKPNTIALFANDKRSSENAPVLKGTIVIDVAEINRLAEGSDKVTMEVAMWAKQSKAGANYWQGSIKESYKKHQSIENNNTTVPYESKDNNDLPF